MSSTRDREGYCVGCFHDHWLEDMVDVQWVIEEKRGLYCEECYDNLLEGYSWSLYN